MQVHEMQEMMKPATKSMKKFVIREAEKITTPAAYGGVHC